MVRRVAGKIRKDSPRGGEESLELFLSLPEAQQFAIRQKLLECLGTESLPHVRNKIGDAVAEIARQYTDEGMSNKSGCEFMSPFSKGEEAGG